MSNAIKQIRKGESIADCMQRIYGVYSGITHKLVLENEVFPTQIAGHGDMWLLSGNHPSGEDVVTAQTFPQDYDFIKQSVEYICGMSVPPVMMKRVVARLIESGVFDYKGVNYDRYRND
jgi:DNA (cytosine-5)-methyltransferase 1